MLLGGICQHGLVPIPNIWKAVRGWMKFLLLMVVWYLIQATDPQDRSPGNAGTCSASPSSLAAARSRRAQVAALEPDAGGLQVRGLRANAEEGYLYAHARYEERLWWWWLHAWWHLWWLRLPHWRRLPQVGIPRRVVCLPACAPRARPTAAARRRHSPWLLLITCVHSRSGRLLHAKGSEKHPKRAHMLTLG